MIDLCYNVYTQQQILYIKLFASKQYDFILIFGYMFQTFITLLLVLLCGYETWSIVLNEEHKWQTY
jgi:hypothetical protein